MGGIAYETTMADHTNHGFDPPNLIERQRQPLNFQSLSSNPKVDGATLNLISLPNELWAFLGPRLADNVYESRIQQAGGEDRHGLELRSNLFQDNEGGAEQVALAGLGRLHRFPARDKRERRGLYWGN